jgi:AGZA family xanthine/uracil permease-like MFS transporter
MGGRAAYTLATALFIGGAGLIGYFSYLYLFIPKAAVFPILVFIGLEITAQSFQATPVRHYAAVAIACIPALAALAWLFVDKLTGEMGLHGISFDQLSAPLRTELETLRVLANGFIVTSLLWASAVAAMIDKRLPSAAKYLAIAAVLSLFGVIHSPLPGAAISFPWNLDPHEFETPIRFASGYFIAALLLWAWSKGIKHENDSPPSGDDDGRDDSSGA